MKYIQFIIILNKKYLWSLYYNHFIGFLSHHKCPFIFILIFEIFKLRRRSLSSLWWGLIVKQDYTSNIERALEPRLMNVVLDHW